MHSHDTASTTRAQDPYAFLGLAGAQPTDTQPVVDRWWRGLGRAELDARWAAVNGVEYRESAQPVAVEEEEGEPPTVEELLLDEHENVVLQRWDILDEVDDLRQELAAKHENDRDRLMQARDLAAEVDGYRRKLAELAATVPAAGINVPGLPASIAAFLTVPELEQAEVADGIDPDVTVEQWMRRHSHEEDAQAIVDLCREEAELRAEIAKRAPPIDMQRLDEDVETYRRQLDEVDDRVFEALRAARDAEIERKALAVPAAIRRNEKGYAEATHENVYAACSNPKLIGIVIGFDEFRGETVISTDGGQNWRAMSDADYVSMHRKLEAARFKRVAQETLRQVVNAVAQQVNRFDTAKLWLDRLRWDGVPRVERFLPTYLGAEDNDYTRAVGQYLWTAMAGRVLDPGCQADMAPVLVGGQGVRKTSTVRAMVPAPEHFAEIDLSKRDTDLSRAMRGLLIGELGELRGLATRDLEAVKTWITQRWESWIPKYLEFGIKFPRRCVFIGTTNEAEFLADPTGERRWLPVRVGNCDPDSVVRDREQLWAEAAAIFRDGGIAWRNAERLARGEHAKYKVHDTWADGIAAWLDGSEGFGTEKRGDQPFTTAQVMAGALRIEAARQNVHEQKRVAKILHSLGFARDANGTRVDGVKARFWRRAEVAA